MIAQQKIPSDNFILEDFLPSQSEVLGTSFDTSSLVSVRGDGQIMF